MFFVKILASFSFVAFGFVMLRENDAKQIL